MKRLAHAGLLVSTVLVLLAGFGLLWLITSNPSHFAGNLLASYLLLWGAFFLLSRRPRAEKMTRFLLASLSLFLVVALLEAPALARLVDYRLVFATPILAPWRNPQNLLDPELVHIRPPHQQLTGASRGGDIARLFHTPSPQLYRYNIRYDRDGFRNAVDLDAADIAVLGDSIIEGPNLSSAQLVTSVLARLQQARVANLGQTGYGPQQELVVLRRYAVPLRPRTVVWAFFEGNDLKNVHF
ncbi:MAG: hypothetical protein HY725_18145 [Candidatus Rokubacteria bacterium]|nr:hypothetical protein [Candidatus Rokubacteria bacterium]